MKRKYSNLGLISVHALRYKADYVRPTEPSERDDELRELGVVPEKALKGQALSLSTRFVPKPYSCHADHDLAMAYQSAVAQAQPSRVTFSAKNPSPYSTSNIDPEVSSLESEFQ